jgi:hypothetical protein
LGPDSFCQELQSSSKDLFVLIRVGRIGVLVKGTGDDPEHGAGHGVWRSWRMEREKGWELLARDPTTERGVLGSPYRGTGIILCNRDDGKTAGVFWREDLRWRFNVRFQ